MYTKKLFTSMYKKLNNKLSFNPSLRFFSCLIMTQLFHMLLFLGQIRP